MQNSKEWTSKGLDGPMEKPRQTNLIINYLPRDVLDEELLDIFSTFGNIKSFKIVRDDEGCCVGYGFVNYENYQSAHVAQVIVNGRQLRHKRLKVAFALPRSNDIAKCNLFIRYVPVNLKEAELENLFENYGKIWSVKILRDKSNGLMHAYVRFKQPADAERARIALDGYFFPGAKQPITVQTAKSLRREDPREDGDFAMEETRGNQSSPPGALERPWSPKPAEEAPMHPEGSMVPEID